MTNKEAIEILKSICGDCRLFPKCAYKKSECFTAIDMAIKVLEQPKRKRGKWIYSEDEYGIDGYHCDKCGFFVPWDYTHKFINYIDDYHYCPNCGHPMGGDDNE